MTRSHSRNAYRPLLFWSAVLAVLLALSGIAGILIGAVGTRSGWWHFSAGLRYAEWGVYGASLALVLALATLIFALRAKGQSLIPSLVALVLSAPVVAMAINWQYAASYYAPINDITTDTEDPPMFWDVPNPMDYPGDGTAAKQRQAYPDIAPLTLKAAPQTVYDLALALIDQRGWSLAGQDRQDGRIEAVVYSALFGFADEVILRIQPGGDGTVVDMRSRSRVGQMDRGVNANRIRAFLSDLEQVAADSQTKG